MSHYLCWQAGLKRYSDVIRGFLLKNVSDFADNPVNVSITTLRGLRFDYLDIQSYLSICFSTVPIYYVSLYLTHYLRQ